MNIGDKQKEQFHENGFIVIRNLFSKEEVTKLNKKAHSDRNLDKASSSMDDGQGNPVRLSLWNHPGDGIYGMFARSKKLVDKVETLLGGGSIPLPFQNGAKRCQGWRCVGLAPGLWVLVPERTSLSATL